MTGFLPFYKLTVASYMRTASFGRYSFVRLLTFVVKDYSADVPLNFKFSNMSLSVFHMCMAKTDALYWHIARYVYDITRRVRYRIPFVTK